MHTWLTACYKLKESLYVLSAPTTLSQPEKSHLKGSRGEPPPALLSFLPHVHKQSLSAQCYLLHATSRSARRQRRGGEVDSLAEL